MKPLTFDVSHVGMLKLTNWYLHDICNIAQNQLELCRSSQSSIWSWILKPIYIFLLRHFIIYTYYLCLNICKPTNTTTASITLVSCCSDVVRELQLIHIFARLYVAYD